MSLIRFLFLTKKKEKKSHLLRTAHSFYHRKCWTLLTETQEFTNNLYLSVHFLVTTRAIVFHIYRADWSWKASRKGLEWMEFKVYRGESTTENIVIKKNVQREKGTITQTRWQEEKETHRRYFWALLAFKLYTRNIDLFLQSITKNSPLGSNANPKTCLSIQMQCCGRPVLLGYQMCFSVSASLIADSKNTCCVCTFTEIFKSSGNHNSVIPRCYPEYPWYKLLDS